ncbi:MAG: metallophosphoesterase [Candidatus Omnitrophota bacterium]|nr:metallophosphoesterase [Candidatus Omnitrophota bacterium]
MTIQEIIGIIVFLVVVGLVALKEVHLLISCSISALRRKPCGPLLCAPGALITHIMAGAGILCFLYGLLIEPYWIEVNRVDIFTDKLKKAHIVLVQISDLHCERTPHLERRVVKIVNSFNPDVVVFTGDAVNDEAAIPLFKDTLASLTAKRGKYAIRGNFDVFIWWNKDLFTKTGFKALTADNSKITKDTDTFYIAGVSRLYPKKWPQALAGIPSNAYTIFMYHTPELIEEVARSHVDLYLAGHTHGGQVALPWYGALITLSTFGKKYESGLYTVGKLIAYINRGIGMEGGAAPRVRFFARPEITVFNIHPRIKPKTEIFKPANEKSSET